MALDKSDLKAPTEKQGEGSDDESDLSGMEDILEHLDEGDQEIKMEKQKIKQRRARQRLSNIVDELNASRGRGRGRKRGKGRGKGRGRKHKLSEVQMEEPEAPASENPHAASSGAAPPAPPAAAVAVEPVPLPDAAAEDEGPVVPEPVASEGRGFKASAPKLFVSPDILDKLAPPQCKLTVNQPESRWVCTWRTLSSNRSWKVPPFNQKTFSRTFSQQNWQQKLEEVHGHMWEKWKCVKTESAFKLASGIAEQTPGSISQQLLVSLKEFVEQMPPPHKKGRGE